MSAYRTTTLKNPTLFEQLNGLWTGKKQPLTKAAVIRNTNFRNDGRLDLSDVAVLDVEARQLETRTLRPGDIIIERSGGGPKQPVGRVCYFDEKGDLPFSFSNFTSVLRVLDPTVFLPRFVHYFLLHLYYIDYTVMLQRATTGIRNLDFDAYLDAEIPLLPLEEQRRIVLFLDLVQTSERLEDEILQTAHATKSAVLEGLLRRGLHREVQRESEIGAIPQSWRVVPLGALGRIGNGSTPLVKNPDYWEGGTIPWLTSAKVYDITITEADRFVTPHAVAECHLPRVRPGSVLVAITGQGKTLGHAAVTAIETCVSQHVAYLQFNDDQTNPHFIRLFLESRYQDLRAVAQGGGSTKGALTCSFLKSYLAPLPKKSEQDEIVDTLMALEQVASIHELKREVLCELFKVFLGGLMTGTIRPEAVTLPSEWQTLVSNVGAL